MIRLNEHYLKLQASYLFSDIARKVEEFQKAHSEARIVRMGIGDVTLPLSPAIIAAFHQGVEEMAREESFRGYGPEQGYSFLRELVAEHDFRSRGAPVEADEIFISDGGKCDTGNFQELFSLEARIGVPDPVYPVYVDTNVMAGRSGGWKGGRYQGLVYLESTEANGFIPSPPKGEVDLIYLCFPNNPTGATASREQLAAWVEYARQHRSLVLFDAAYAAYIRDPSLPHSIYEIEGAREVAVEFRSFSKTAGFTGTRCAYTVIPKDCRVYDRRGQPLPLRPYWNRRQTTKFNGVSYPVQKAAAATYSPEGQKECREMADYYLNNARLIRAGMQELGFPCTGGDNSPYIWVKTGTDSWAFFDRLLEDCAVVCTPGSGFGRCGEGYIRLSAFNHRERVEEGLQRMRDKGIRFS